MATDTRSGWQTYALTEVFDVRSGLSKPASEFGSGFPFVTFKDVLDNYFLPETLGSLVRSSDSERELCDVRRGDVFLTRTSETQEDLGMSSVALRDYEAATFNGFTKRLRPKDPRAIVPEYAAYYLRSPRFRSEMSAFSSLSTRASLNNDMLSRLQIVLPDVKTQEAIGFTLRSLDDKIEQNRRTGAKLEGLARGVFKAWFVDFEPVKAKAAGATAFPGMPPETFAALPTRFTNSALGRVPEGWSPSPIGDSVEDIYDGPHATPPESTDGAVFLGIKNLTGTRIDLGDIRRINERDWPRWTKRVEPRADDIVFTYEATIGFFAIIPPGLRCCLGRRMALMRPTAGVSSRYLFHYAISDRFQQLLAERTVYGSTVNRTSLLEFPKYLILMPTPALVTGFDSVVAPLWSSLHASDTESAKLATLRDYLLPRLLSGRVRVRAVRD